jgi:hypothetical protein
MRDVVLRTQAMKTKPIVVSIKSKDGARNRWVCVEGVALLTAILREHGFRVTQFKSSRDLKRFQYRSTSGRRQDESSRGVSQLAPPSFLRLGHFDSSDDDEMDAMSGD